MFTRRLFNIGRQICSSNILNRFQNPLFAQRNTIFKESLTKVEFFKTPIVEQKTCQSVIKNVNELVKKETEGRLFAVVHLAGKQYKVTDGDIIIIEGYWAPTIADKIRLEKVLLVGGDNFTLTGRPLVQPNLVDVQATIVEKSIAHTRTNFRFKKRKNYRRIQFHRSALTMIRINSITLNPKIDVNAPQQNLIE